MLNFSPKKESILSDHKKYQRGSLIVWGENNLSPCLPLAPAKAAKGNCMGVTLVGEDDVIGTENNSILVPSFVISMPLLAFLTKFPFVSTPANRVGLCEVSIGVNEETKFLLRMFIRKIIIITYRLPRQRGLHKQLPSDCFMTSGVAVKNSKWKKCHLVKHLAVGLEMDSLFLLTGINRLKFDWVVGGTQL